MQATLFSSEQTNSAKWYLFKRSELGRMHSCIPLEALGECLPKVTRHGAPRWFSRPGMFSLMFLKHYLGLSDEMLIDRLNCDYELQLFCGILLQDNERIKDNSIVSRIRSYIGHHADLDKVQQVMIEHWRSDLDHHHMLMMDATCYESFIRYPSDVKLLWECCEWVYTKQLFELCKELSVARPRSKYLDQKLKQLNYTRNKKRSYKQMLRRKKSLIYLLEKGIGQLQELLNVHGSKLVDTLPACFFTTFKTIKTILQQQQYLYSNAGSSLSDRIVSLHKPWVRTIVRGKENKPVEFGPKVHMMQVGGINIIENYSYQNFNECTRLKASTFKHTRMFGECNHLAADRIYATNRNRKFLTDKKIITNFVRKGAKSKVKEPVKRILNNLRNTRLEGSFGTEKEFYGLRKIKARLEHTERVWVYMGVITSNLVRMASKLEEKQKQAA